MGPPFDSVHLPEKTVWILWFMDFYGRYDEVVNGGYKPSYNSGTPSRMGVSADGVYICLWPLWQGNMMKIRCVLGYPILHKPIWRFQSWSTPKPSKLFGFYQSEKEWFVRLAMLQDTSTWRQQKTTEYDILCQTLTNLELGAMRHRINIIERTGRSPHEKEHGKITNNKEPR